MKQRPVMPAFWTDDKIQPLGPITKAVALFFLTTPDGNWLGAFHCPFSLIISRLYGELDPHAPAAVTKLRNRAETVREAVFELIEIGFISYCERTHWVWIKHYLERNRPPNPNALAGVLAAADDVPTSVSFYSEFKDMLNRWTTVAKPMTSPARTRTHPSSSLRSSKVSSSLRSDSKKPSSSSSDSVSPTRAPARATPRQLDDDDDSRKSRSRRTNQKPKPVPGPTPAPAAPPAAKADGAGHDPPAAQGFPATAAESDLYVDALNLVAEVDAERLIPRLLQLHGGDCGRVARIVERAAKAENPAGYLQRALKPP